MQKQLGSKLSIKLSQSLSKLSLQTSATPGLIFALLSSQSTPKTHKLLP